MKTILSTLLLSAMTFSLAGCFSYESRGSREVVVTPAPVVRETVVTTLPRGYRTRVYRGTTYYTYNRTYYRSTPRGYVVVERPW